MLPQKSSTSRSKVNCPILEISADLKANVLPTTHDLLKYYEPTLASRKPREMALSRWYSTASRALRVYVSTEEPTSNFKQVVQYIMTPMWFQIKHNYTISQAQLHVFGTLSKYQKLPSQVRKIEIPVIQRNALGAHHESILAAMVSSTNLNHNELAWRRILYSREQSVSDGRIRQLRVPN